MEENRPTKGLEALNFTSNGNGTCYVSGIGTCKDTDIVIPSVYNGMRVTSIGNDAFYYRYSLTSITIPDSVTSIGDAAFAYCSGLTSIMFNGTIAQWNAISKGFDWKYNVPATEVICSDGIVSLN